MIKNSQTTARSKQDVFPDAASPSPDGGKSSSRLVLPFFSNRLSDPPSYELCEAAERANAGVIGFLLQGVDIEAMPRPADERLAEALAPLRIKLDMVIEMLVRLSHPNTELPPLRNVELTRTQIAWLSLGPTETGDWLRVELYFHPTFREPVVLLAQVSNCVVQGPQEGYRIEAELVRMSEETCENLARLSFLTHRQQRRVRAAAARAT